MNSLLRRIFRDFALKLAAIFLATALFLHVKKEGIREELFRVPIDWQGTRPAGEGALPDSGLVRIRAAARDLDRIRRQGARLRLTPGVDPERIWQTPTGADLILPNDVRVSETTVLEPTSTRVGTPVRPK